MNDLFSIARLANAVQLFQPCVSELGFGSAGEIDRFIFGPYAKAIKRIRKADRPRGAIFVLEPANTPDALGTPEALESLILQIQEAATAKFFTLRLDLSGNLTVAYTCEPADQRLLADGAWTQQIAQQYSRNTKKCVVWAMGVGVEVFIGGDLYRDSPDVIEELPAGCPIDFQNVSWDDGGIMFDFAESDLNDTGSTGIWQLPAAHVLKPRPEELIRSRLGNFLRFRLAGYSQHYEEPHVEHEGRADVALHLVDARIFIIEVKWVGRSLVARRIGETDKNIEAAIANNSKGWLTQFDDHTFDSGIRQLVNYYKTGKYRRAYLTVFDCTENAVSTDSCYVPVVANQLDGHSPANFRAQRACVDPRTASKRVKKKAKKNSETQ